MQFIKFNFRDKFAVNIYDFISSLLFSINSLLIFVILIEAWLECYTHDMMFSLVKYFFGKQLTQIEQRTSWDNLFLFSWIKLNL